MKTIQYKFNDGTRKEISVTDELYALHLELLQEEKRNHWKETRRHISLNYLMEQGADILRREQKQRQAETRRKRKRETLIYVLPVALINP